MEGIAETKFAQARAPPLTIQKRRKSFVPRTTKDFILDRYMHCTLHSSGDKNALSTETVGHGAVQAQTGWSVVHMSKLFQLARHDQVVLKPIYVAPGFSP